MAVYITKDNFAWLDVTERMKYGMKKREEVWMAHELYVVHDDDSDSLIESHDEIDEALKLGLRICIEVGLLPKPKTIAIQNWHEVDKRIIDGHWWVKFGSQKFAQSK